MPDTSMKIVGYEVRQRTLPGQMPVILGSYGSYTEALNVAIQTRRGEINTNPLEIVEIRANGQSRIVS